MARPGRPFESRIRVKEDGRAFSERQNARLSWPRFDSIDEPKSRCRFLRLAVDPLFAPYPRPRLFQFTGRVLSGRGEARTMRNPRLKREQRFPFIRPAMPWTRGGQLTELIPANASAGTGFSQEAILLKGFADIRRNSTNGAQHYLRVYILIPGRGGFSSMALVNRA